VFEAHEPVARDRFRVLIAGAGVAAIETLLALRHTAGDRLEIDLLAPTPDFVYRPLTVLEPFGGGEPPRIPVSTIARDHDAGHVLDGLVAVDAESHTIRTTRGDVFGYDALVVATGARTVEGLPGSLTFPSPDGVHEFRGVLADLAEGRVRRVAFAVPRQVTWTLPLYELALLTSTFLETRRSNRAELMIVTPEPAPLAAFGEPAAEMVGKLLARHAVAIHSGALPKLAEPGGVRLADDRLVAADRVVSLPALVGPDIAGLPTDNGFIPVDEHGRVRVVDDVYAAGDATTWTPKQGGLAAQQGDVVAEALAERVGAPVRPSPYRPVLRGIVLTGAEPAFLRSDAAGHRRRAMSTLRPLWWPPAKVAGRYLSPYLAARGISLAA
jgi:sulfide:quinone oxidoreductase